jgi:hypothetical protein
MLSEASSSFPLHRVDDPSPPITSRNQRRGAAPHRATYTYARPDHPLLICRAGSEGYRRVAIRKQSRLGPNELMTMRLRRKKSRMYSSPGRGNETQSSRWIKPQLMS